MISPPLPWQVRYEPGVPTDIPATAEAFPELLAKAAANAPGAPALAYFNRRFSYAELDKAVDGAARACLRDGLEPGDRVLLALPNNPPAVVAALGALRAGAVLLPRPVGADPRALARIVERARPVLAFASPSLVDELQQAGIQRLVRVGGESGLPLSLRLLRRIAGPADKAGRLGVEWSDWLGADGPQELPELDGDHPALMDFDPRQDEAGPIRFAHHHLVAGARQLQFWMTDARPGDDGWLLLAPVVGPLGLTAGLGCAVALQARLLLLPVWRSPDLADAVRYLRPSYVLASDRAVRSLVARPELAHMDLRSVRAWITAGDVGPACVHAFETATGLSLCQGYAPPGVAGLATCNPVNGRRVEGSVGLPLPGVQVRAGAGEGEVGPLEIRGPNVAAEPWLPAAGRARLDAAGYVHLEAE